MDNLAQAYQAYFPVGAAVTLASLRSHRRLLRHFNSLTAENYMKPMYMHPSEDEYNFRYADKIVDYAMQSKKRLRGHTLVWHNQTPGWFFAQGGEKASRALVLSRMEDHISTVMGHFCAAAYAWDVVNEPIEDDDGKGLLRESPWRAAIGDDYIAHAFRFARKADPACVLFLNEYNETAPAKRGRIAELARALRADGVPLDGIGMQGHYNLYGPSADEIAEAIEVYAALGLQVQVTELDISLFAFEDHTVYTQPPQELIELQAKRYRQVFEVLRRYHRYVSGVTLWGLADDTSWLSNFPVKKRKNWPLLFDDAHNPKPALEEVLQAARQPLAR